MVGGSADMVGGKHRRGWRKRRRDMVPSPFQTTGREPPAAAFSEPPAETGESPARASDQADRGLPSETPRSAAHPADRNGKHPQGAADVPLTKGTPREQCRRRPKGRNGCEWDQRTNHPRFRSASIDRKHRSNARHSYRQPEACTPGADGRRPQRTPVPRRCLSVQTPTLTPPEGFSTRQAACRPAPFLLGCPKCH